jgi:hypothetical protein
MSCEEDKFQNVIDKTSFIEIISTTYSAADLRLIGNVSTFCQTVSNTSSNPQAYQVLKKTQSGVLRAYTYCTYSPPSVQSPQTNKCSSTTLYPPTVQRFCPCYGTCLRSSDLSNITSSKKDKNLNIYYSFE